MSNLIIPFISEVSAQIWKNAHPGKVESDTVLELLISIMSTTSSKKS